MKLLSNFLKLGSTLQRITRSKYKLIVQRDNFHPQSRSTELNQINPFKPQTNLNRSPPPTPIENKEITPPSSIEESENILVDINNKDQSQSANDKLENISTHQSYIWDNYNPNETLYSHKEPEISRKSNYNSNEILHIYKKPETSRESKEPFKNMDTTLGAAAAAERTPSLPKFVSPAIFNPCTSNPIQFIRSYERAAIANGWNDTHKINYFSCFLEGAASVWYDKYTSKARNASKTWKEIAQDFITEFGGENPLKQIKFKWNKRRQGDTEDIKHYFFDLYYLANELDPNMTFDKFKEHFEEGLHPSYFEMYYMMCQPTMEMDDLKALIIKISGIKEKALVAQMSQQTAFLTINPKESTSDIQRNSERRNSIQDEYRNENRYNTRENSDRNNYRQERNYRRNRLNSNERRPPKQYGRTNLPPTRTSDGRTRCFICNKPGHYAATCWYNDEERTSQNDKRRRELTPERPQRRVSFSENNLRHPNSKGRRQ